MGFVGRYLWDRRGGAALGAACLLLCEAVFAFYGLPRQALAYPAALCLAAGAVRLGAGCALAYRRHRTLERLLSLPENLTELLPPCRNQDERDYQALLRRLKRAGDDRGRAWSERYGDMMDYYATWAHQVKTPIAAMRLALQAEDSPLSRRLTGELCRVEQYVEMVMTYLRLDAEDTDYVFAQHELGSIVSQSIRKFAPQFIDKGLKLVYKPIRAAVVTDEKWLSFVLDQVLSNALKYTAAGSITIALEPPLTLCVRDTGMGIAPEDLPRVFDKGYTGFHGRRDKRASGLGLYLCKRVCGNLGCGIAVASQAGRGTQVRLTLRPPPERLE